MKKALAITNQFPSPENRKYGLNTGVSYYRQIMPGKHLEGWEFHHLGHKLLDLSSENAEKAMFDLFFGHDLVFSKHMDNPVGIYLILGTCAKLDIPLILDFDDNVFCTDGLSGPKMSYPESNEARAYAEMFIREATAITVSTPALLEVYRKYNKNVFVCPNAVDLADWTVTRKQHDRLTVGWPASASHTVDHTEFEPAMAELVKKYPDIVFSMMGHYMPDHLAFLPRKNWELKPGITWWDGNPKDNRTYPGILADLGADIGVAPLIKSQFNEARSLAKWFEYTMTGTPLVASEYGPYVNLRDNEDALLVQTVDGWVNAISNLIEKPNERQRLVTNSLNRIKSEFTIQHTAPAWREVFNKFTTFKPDEA